MKSKLWLFQIPIIILFTTCYVITESGSDGTLPYGFVSQKIFPPLRAVSGFFTNQKFKLRGKQAPKNKIAIVAIDGESLSDYGRWPWHRDLTAKLIDKAFEAGAKVVGLDIVFSEPDKRVPAEMSEILKGQNMGNLVDLFETDPALANAIQKYSDRLVVGWMSEANCTPKYADKDECPVTLPEALASLPTEMPKFSFDAFSSGTGFDPASTPLWSAVTITPNIPEYSAAAKHAGTFNINTDPDGYVRRTGLVMMANGKPYPSLALEVARVAKGEGLQLDLANNRVASLKWFHSGKPINVNPRGVMEINFRGGGETFPYVSAKDLLLSGPQTDSTGRSIASTKDLSVLKDAVVFIGLTALGVYDMRAFPFDSNVAGVEGHANILDNLLSDDALTSATTGNGTGFIILLALMTLGAFVFSYAMQILEAVQAMFLFVAVFGGVAVMDTQLLFKHNINWDTGFFGIEIFSIFVFTMAAKYVMEERNKKFIKSAFAKYVAPSIVDSILKDPSKLSLGGEKKDLTILFSDIRGFTTFSEQMDAKKLSSFLNDYLGIMTKIVFDHDGTLDKYIGDAVMAFWGAPLDQPKHAYNCAMSAMAMMRALADNRDRFKTQYGVDVRVGIGINTGFVSVGNMGSETNFEYTVIGDHVNLASRLEGLTKEYGVSIVTTRFTMDHIKELGVPLPSHRVLDHVKVKGKKNAVELIQLCEFPLPELGAKLFDQAVELYKSQQWDAAIAKFNEANHAFGGTDGPCGIYMERCEDFKKTPPGPTWDGSWEMHSK